MAALHWLQLWAILSTVFNDFVLSIFFKFGFIMSLNSFSVYNMILYLLWICSIKPAFPIYAKMYRWTFSFVQCLVTLLESPSSVLQNSQKIEKFSKKSKKYYYVTFTYYVIATLDHLFWILWPQISYGRHQVIPFQEFWYGYSILKSSEIDYYVTLTDYVISTWNQDFWILRPKIR